MSFLVQKSLPLVKMGSFMNLQLSVPLELENSLKKRAAMSGKDIATFIIDTLKEELTQEEVMATSKSTDDSFSTWLSRWRNLAPKTSHFVDDSRESIYEGRGE
jgi:hypothetical protein